MYFRNFSDISFSSLSKTATSTNYHLVFVAEKSADEAQLLIDGFNSHNMKLFGGIYPTIFSDEQNYEQGFLVLEIPPVEEVIRLSAEDENFFDSDLDLDSVGTAILLTDGLMGETDAFLRKIYNFFGNQMNIVGGGAGFMTLKQAPCIFTNEGIFQDGGVIALLKSESKIGVKHGWEVFEGPFIATSTEKNIIKELNWRPAFEVYKEAIESNSEYSFRDGNFFDIAKVFPFGIYKEGTEYIIRDPFILNDDGSITCISEIPENSTLQILTGDPNTLINAAKEVAEMTLTQKTERSCLLVFDCITRVMYLNERFKDELAAMKTVYDAEGSKIRGVATLGEIASSGTGFVEFYNKTIVACSLNS
ncbi:hypothetical protein EGI26_15045 [Lacihabitans sp. CCS-44]|uniref:FIST signal transduction protein n=1 Tax=Lacihabitans sp. CCS-44 TaxID=2487331 RepID=UPI0020CC05E2|nr:FIST C-terminal domain-containing protein [Lacihabitans sp. CCS-44]MCP9756479.1 hypothetical protein [Lacihabitans sp. CCS-44]